MITPNEIEQIKKKAVLEGLHAAILDYGHQARQNIDRALASTDSKDFLSCLRDADAAINQARMIMAEELRVCGHGTEAANLELEALARDKEITSKGLTGE